MFVNSPALSIGIKDDPSGRRGDVALSYRKDLAELPYSRQGIELGLGLLHGVVQALLGDVIGRVLDRDRRRHRVPVRIGRSHLEAGGYLSKPRGELHTMWNAGPDEARMIEIITPSGFENFFQELAEVFEPDPPTPPPWSHWQPPTACSSTPPGSPNSWPSTG